jgi:hypothetical protein
MMMATLSWALTWFAGAVFLHSAWSKWSVPEAFVPLVSRYLGRSVSIAGVRVIALLEGAIAMAALLPATSSLGAFVVALMLLSYAFAMARLWYQGVRDMRCGCGGPASETRIGPALMVRNTLLALLLFGIVMSDSATAAQASWWVGASFAALLWVLWQALDVIIRNNQLMGEIRG